VAYGESSAIFGPLAAHWLIPTYGWRATFSIFGSTFFVMTMIGAFLLQNPPAGYTPKGWTPGVALASSAIPASEFTPIRVLRTRTFYLMWLAYALGTAASVTVIGQIVPYARSVGMVLELATAAIFIGALGNAGGVFFSGWVSGALGRLKVLRLAIAISAVAMALLFHTGPNVLVFFLLVFVVYYCYGTQHSVNASAAADFWGASHLGVNYYLLFTASAGGAIIQSISGMHYRIVSHIAPAMAAIALVCELLARRPEEPADAEHFAETSP